MSTKKKEKAEAASVNGKKKKSQKEDVNNKIETLQKELDEQKEKYLRLFADFDNSKKRHARERLELIQTAGKDIIINLLPALDDINRALSSAEQSTDINAVMEGLKLIKNKLFGQLEQKGLKAMSSVGESFDAEKHEAITEIPAPSKDMKGKVVDEIEKGYYLNDKIIRYAKVVVGK